MYAVVLVKSDDGCEVPCVLYTNGETDSNRAVYESIDDALYCLDKFAEEHPGGKYAIMRIADVVDVQVAVSISEDFGAGPLFNYSAAEINQAFDEPNEPDWDNVWSELCNDPDCYECNGVFDAA
jgi:hypothetical protein